MASISAPTSLTTFSQPHASSSKSPHVRLSPVVGDPKCAVAAVQGDGVWTYDLSTLRATTSFTVPPATVFSTAPVSFWTTKKVATSADEDGAMEVDTSEGDDVEEVSKVVKERVTLVGVGKEVWVWRGEDGEKEVVRINYPVKVIHPLPSSLYPILVISSSSRFHLLDSAFAPQTITLPTVGGSDLLASRVVSPSSEESIRVAVVDVNGRVDVVKITLGDKRTEKILEGRVGKGNLVYADVSEDGVISVLDDKHNLFSIAARDLSAPSTTAIHLLHPSANPILLPLPTSSLPLLVLPTSHPSPSLLLTIPSPSIPSVLATTPLSSFTSSGTISSLAILSSRGGVHTVGVVLNHTHGDGDVSGGRSVVYVCEVVVPERGVGMGMLLGTQARTKTYFETPDTSAAGKGNKSEVEKAQDGLLSSLEAALKRKEGAEKAAEKVWKEWSSKEPASALSDKVVRRVVGTVFSAALNEEGKVKGGYAGYIVQDLVGRGVVSDGMWKEGVVVDGLLPVGDWDTILLALTKIPTLSSSALPALLTAALHSPEAPGVPTLPTLLQRIMAGPSPGPTFKRELYKGLSVDDATSVLSQLVSFAEAHVEARSDGLSGWDLDLNPAAGAAALPPTLPSLGSTITFSSCLLDAHLPSFVSHPGSHDLLARMQLALEPLLAVQNEYRQLRGPVEALLTLARREARKSEERAAANGGRGKGGKKGRKEGGARLPEEAVGKWRVEDLVF